MALEDQNQMENVGGRGDVPSCHKVNVFMSRETPAGSPSVVYVVKGGGTCGANRNEVGVMPSPPSLRGRKPSKRFKYVFSSTFPRGSRNGADRARSGGLINGDEPSVSPRTVRQQFITSGAQLRSHRS